MCDGDSIRLSMNVSRDNSISSVQVDGGAVLFSEPTTVSATNHSTHNPLTFTNPVMYLAAGSHFVDITLQNTDISSTNNPTALMVPRTVSSLSGNLSI